MPPAWYALFLTRQGASSFNQPLSFDTSKVTDMSVIFYVRASPPIPNQTLACMFLVPLPLHALPPPTCMPPALYAFLSPWQNANSLSNANKLLIRCAWSGNTYFTTDYDSSWSSLGACSPAPSPPPPSPSPPTAPPPSPSLPPPVCAGG
eukprot:scaffold62917_cov58-Phaeocystis_antarctica.AAC.5